MGLHQLEFLKNRYLCFFEFLIAKHFYYLSQPYFWQSQLLIHVISFQNVGIAATPETHYSFNWVYAAPRSISASFFSNFLMQLGILEVLSQNLQLAGILVSVIRNFDTLNNEIHLTRKQNCSLQVGWFETTTSLVVTSWNLHLEVLKLMSHIIDECC